MKTLTASPRAATNRLASIPSVLTVGTNGNGNGHAKRTPDKAPPVADKPDEDQAFEIRLVASYESYVSGATTLTACIAEALNERNYTAEDVVDVLTDAGNDEAAVRSIVCRILVAAGIRRKAKGQGRKFAAEIVNLSSPFAASAGTHDYTRLAKLASSLSRYFAQQAKLQK